MKNRRFVIVVDPDTHQKLEAYSELTGVATSRIAAEGLADWIETVGAARLEALTPSASDNVIEMPTANVRGTAAGKT